jgi:Transposase IS116/IS110/IS902 family
MGEPYVGIDLHRRRWGIVRMTLRARCCRPSGSTTTRWRCRWSWPRPAPTLRSCSRRPTAGRGPPTCSQACGARVHLAHPLGSRCSATSGPETDARDSTNLAELLRMQRLPEAWLAPPQVRELRELVGYRAKLVALRSGLKGPGPRRARHAGRSGADERPVRGGRHPAAGRAAPWTRRWLRIASLRRLLVAYDPQITMLGREIAAALTGDTGDLAIQAIPGWARCWPGVFVAEIGDVGRFAAAPQRCSWAGLTPRHHESDTTVRRGGDNQTGPQAGALGRGRGHPAAPRHKQAGRLVPPHRRPARHRYHPGSRPPASC